jgi:uncharacterized Zn-finger protein
MYSLQRHLKRHDGTRPFACSYAGCRRAFVEKCALQRHERSHRKEQPYSCSEQGCGKRFADKSNLDRHRMMHAGYKPFVCECSRGFFRRAEMNRHATSCEAAKATSRGREQRVVSAPTVARSA